MSDMKTVPTQQAVEEFLAAIEPPRRREDGQTLLKMFSDITGEEPRMWGPTIVGFGQYHYRYESGHEGDSMLTGFSPRKARLSIYIMAGFDQYGDLLARLGKHKIGKDCLYINKLADIDEDVLRELVAESVAYMREKYTG